MYQGKHNSISQNEHFILLPIHNKNKLDYQNITNNNENEDDFDFNLVKPTTEKENNPSPLIRRHPLPVEN